MFASPAPVESIECLTPVVSENYGATIIRFASIDSVRPIAPPQITIQANSPKDRSNWSCSNDRYVRFDEPCMTPTNDTVGSA